MNQHLVCFMVQYSDPELFVEMTVILERLHPSVEFSVEEVMRIYGRISKEQSWCDDLNEHLLASFYELVEAGQTEWDNDTYLAYLDEHS